MDAGNGFLARPKPDGASGFGRHLSDLLVSRLRGVFLTAAGGEKSEIENAFCAAIKTAKEQKSA